MSRAIVQRNVLRFVHIPEFREKRQRETSVEEGRDQNDCQRCGLDSMLVLGSHVECEAKGNCASKARKPQHNLHGLRHLVLLSIVDEVRERKNVERTSHHADYVARNHKAGVEVVVLEAEDAHSDVCEHE